jgi:hypothetical protein
MRDAIVVNVWRLRQWWRLLLGSSKCVHTYIHTYTPTRKVARFSWYFIPKRGKYNKWPKYIPKGHKIYPNGRNIYQMAIKCTNIFLSRPSKVYPNWYFWKKHHLATLAEKLSIDSDTYVHCCNVEKWAFKLASCWGGENPRKKSFVQPVQ